MTRIISLSDEAYNALSALKTEKDSFSTVVLRIANKELKKSLLTFAGKWSGKEEIDKIFNEILTTRKSVKLKEVRI